ncbi:MAG: hypothetical protein HC769_30630 [Cyanobacteria bacterium CRU_2_1]|nr:hypothetical protein [Cyanobacteria bacterium CRU_2_1]
MKIIGAIAAGIGTVIAAILTAQNAPWWITKIESILGGNSTSSSPELTTSQTQSSPTPTPSVSTTPTSTPSPTPTPLQAIEAEQTARDKGVTSDLLQCVKDNQNTICHLRITRTTDGICGIDRRAVRAIDLAGNEHFAEAVQMGSEEGSWVTTNLIRDIPIRASFTFGNDLQTVNNLAAVEFGTGYNDACGHFVFRDVVVK